MRQLIIDKITEFAADGFDLSDLEFSAPTTVSSLPTLSDEQLLEIYTEAVGFNG